MLTVQRWADLMNPSVEKVSRLKKKLPTQFWMIFLITSETTLMRSLSIPRADITMNLFEATSRSLIS